MCEKGYRQLPALVWLLPLILAFSPMMSADKEVTKKSSASDLPAAGWVEVTPLDIKTKPGLFLFTPADLPLVLRDIKESRSVVCTGGDGFSSDCQVMAVRPGDSLEPTLRLGVHVTGRLMVNREPVKGVRVAIFPAELSARRTFHVPLFLEKGKIIREVVTDADGRFKTTQLGPGVYRLEMSFPDGREHLTDSFSVPPPEALLPKTPANERNRPAVLDRGELDLALGCSVEFFVTDVFGEPIADAMVSGSQGEEPGAGSSARTDDTGHSVIFGLDPELPLTAYCHAAGYPWFRERFDIVPMVVECVLEPFAGIEGVVKDERGEGISAVTVSIQGSSEESSHRTATDKQGEYRIVGVVPDTYDLIAAAPGFLVEELEVEVPPVKTLEVPPIHLTPAPEFLGIVRDARNEEPVADASVISISPPGAVAATSDELGELVLATDPERPLRLKATASGYAPTVRDISPGELSEEEPLVIELSIGGRIEVSVWDEALDSPCHGCSVAIIKEDGLLELQGLQTDVNGMAYSEDLPAGLYHGILEEIRSIGSAVHVDAGAKTKPVQVVPGVVSRIVFGQRRQVVQVRFWPPPPVGWQLEASGPSDLMSYDMQSGGSFAVRKSPGEQLTLKLKRPGSLTVYQGMIPSDYDERYMDITLPQTRVTGTLIAGGVVAAGYDVNVRSATGSNNRAWAVTAVDGSFSIPFLHEDVYWLIFGENGTKTFQVPSDGTVDLGTLTLGVE
ncbi:MAG: hypothetical protein GY856_41695 [bacterium]|nr:hypothetical protein [bacterium]